jgi:hypothetical protein
MTIEALQPTVIEQDEVGSKAAEWSEEHGSYARVRGGEAREDFGTYSISYKKFGGGYVCSREEF